MKYLNVPHGRLLTIKYVSPTNTRNSKIVMSWQLDHEGNKAKKYFPYDYGISSVLEQAIVTLNKLGVPIIARAEVKHDYALIVDSETINEKMGY